MLSLRALDGRIVALVAAAIAVLLVTVAPGSPSAFVIVVAIGGVVLVYAAMRWPLPTLVLSALMTVVDMVITPRVLPDVFERSPIGLSEPMLALTGLGIALGALRGGRFLAAFRDPVFPLALLFVALAVASAIVNATPPVVAVLGIVMTLDALAIYFAVRMVPVDERGAAAAVAAIVVTIVAAALFGLIQAIVDPDLLGFTAVRGNHGEGARITSVLGNPNMLAAVIVLAMPFVLLASLRLEQARLRWAARAALFVLACALLLTFSRGAWLAVGLATLIGGMLVDWRAVPLLVLTVAVAWAAVAVVPRAALPEGRRDAGAQANEADEPRRGGSDEGPDPRTSASAGASGGQEAGGDPPDAEGPSIIDSTIERLRNLGTRARYLREGLPIILDHPFLGVGPGRYGGAAAAIIPSPVYEEYGTRLFGFRTVHNFWLHLLGEAGALGTAVFLTMLAGLLIRFVRAARGSLGLRFVLLGGAAIMLLVAIFHSLTEMIFEGNMPVIILWLVLGIASLLAPSVALFGRLERDGSAAPPEALSG